MTASVPARARPDAGPRAFPLLRTLRGRMAAAYTLLTLVITGILAVVAFTAFRYALWEGVRAEASGSSRALAAMFSDPAAALRSPPEVAPNVYYQVEGTDGTPLLASANLEGAAIPAGASGPVSLGSRGLYVQRTPWMREGVPYGTFVVAVDSQGVLNSSRLAAWLLAGFVLLATGLALPLGFVIGGRSLARLEEAARLASQVDPVDPRPLKLVGPTDDEVGTLAVALDRTLERIRERQFAERAFLAEVAHELGTPLTVLTGRLERLAAEDPDPRLRAARDAALDIARTSEDLLLLARGALGASGRAPVREHYLVDLCELVPRVGAEFEGAQAHVTCQSPGGRLDVVADPHGLRQAVRNLLRNAVRAAAVTGGAVRVRLRRDADEAVI
ncbi:MAG TPA: HAMP domain-containing sensor histidine kinase, partial [Deinococcales bacterium]|nr:HAMP domain-containing sensor histidine kinase [Deinococcales bacterium]